MKLRRVHIENFRRIEKLTLELWPKYLPEPLMLNAIVGDNGSGKTSVLQAIALTLSLATRRFASTLQFKWRGLLPERMAAPGRSTRIELEVSFEEDEIDAIQEAHATAKRLGVRMERHEKPGDQREVRLVYENKHADSPDGPRGFWQFRGRHYVRQAQALENIGTSLLDRIGDVFWYDQFRSIASLGAGMEQITRSAKRSSASEIAELRENLVGWWAYHKSDDKSNGPDYIVELEKRFADIFPGTSFRGVAPRGSARGSGTKDFYFLLEREKKTFDLEEMSSGEQAVFPLVCDFVRSRIKRSVVLIDELELHLHPPEQQGLLSNLPRLGPECQFLFSTHSSFVEGSLIRDQITRLPGGRLCL